MKRKLNNESGKEMKKKIMKKWKEKERKPEKEGRKGRNDNDNEIMSIRRVKANEKYNLNERR